MPLVPVFYKNQDSNWEQPSAMVERTELRLKRDRGEGRFVNNGRAFRLHKSHPSFVSPRQPQPDTKDRGHDGRGRESCVVDEPTDGRIGTVSRFVMQDRLAMAIVEAWRPQFRTVMA